MDQNNLNTSKLQQFFSAQIYFDQNPGGCNFCSRDVAMGKHNRSGARAMTPAARKRANRATTLDSIAEEIEPEIVPETVPEPVQVKLVGSLAQLAPLLWVSNYGPLYEMEEAALEESGGLMSAASDLRLSAPASTYQQRGRAKERPALERERLRRQAAAVLRQANQWRHSFTVCVNSVLALSRRLPYLEWRKQCEMRQLVDRKTATKLLYHMMTVRPPLPFLATSAVQQFVYDQKYCKKGESRGKHRGPEKVDAAGDLIELVSMVYLNTIKVPLP
jgi:hypothetical protein